MLPSRVSATKERAVVVSGAVSNILKPSPATTNSPSPLTSLLPSSLNPCNTLINSVISSIITNKSPTLPLSLLPFLGPNEVTSILLRTQSHPIGALHFFLSLPTLPSASQFGILSHSLAAAHFFADASSLLLRFLHLHPSVDHFDSLRSPHPHCIHCEATFSLLVKSYVKARSVRNAFLALRRSVAAGFVPDVYTFNAVLSALVKERRFEQCWEVYGQMVILGVAMNTYTFNVLIHALCRAGDAEKAMEFLEEIEEKGFEPDVVTYNTLLDGYVKRRRIKDAFNLWEKMPLRGVVPSLVSYSIMMGALCGSGRTVEAHRMLDQMEKSHLTPDSFVYNIIIAGYCKEGRLREACLLFLEMLERALILDEFTFRLVVDTHVKVGKLDTCLHFISEIRKWRVPVSADTYVSLIIALCKEKRPQDAKAVMNWMTECGHSLSLELYNEIIDCFCLCDCISDAFDLKEDMEKQDIRPNLRTYWILISCLCRKGKILDAESLLTKMISAGIKPNDVFCAALVEGWCKQRDLTGAELTLKYFAHEFQVYSIDGYNVLMRAHCEAGCMDESLELHDRMRDLGYVSTRDSCRSIIRVLSKTQSL